MEEGQLSAFVQEEKHLDNANSLSSVALRMSSSHAEARKTDLTHW